MTGRDIFFAGFIAVWFLLLFLLGNTFLGMYWYVLFFAAFLLYFRSFRPILSENTLALGRLWLPFLIFTGFSLVVTIYFPLTLEKTVFYFFSALFFTAVMVFHETKPKTAELSLAFLPLIFLVLGLLSVFFAFFPSFGEKLPGMNVLYSSVGHSHFGALLVMGIPLLWYLFFRRKSKNSLVLAHLFLVAAFFTLGRVILLILFFQHLLLALYSKKWLLQPPFQSLKPVFQVYLKAAAVVFFAGGIFWLVSFAWCHQGDDLTHKYCRYQSFESRMLYWQQALEVIQEQPLLGSGLGTYALAARKYEHQVQAFSDFPHNYLLLIFAEGGLAGGVIFLLFLGRIFFRALQKVQEELARGKPLKFLLMLAVTGSFLNALVDFDWSFTGIFLLTFFLLAGVLADQSSSQLEKPAAAMLKKGSLFSVVLLTGVVGIYAFTDILIASGQTSQAFRFFPYFYWQSQVFAQSDHLSEQQRTELLNFQGANSEVAEKIIASEPAGSELRTAAFQKLQQYNPRKRISVNRLNEFKNAEQYEAFFAEAKNIVSLIDAQQRERGNTLTASETAWFIQQVGTAAGELYQRGQYRQSAELLLLGRQLDPWAIDFITPPFQKADEASLVGRYEFSAQLTAIEPAYFGQYQFEYAEYFYQTVKLIVAGQTSFADRLVLKKILDQSILLFPGFKADAEQEIGPLI